jgi:creatinine amidohydrolase/Fe(II)-dependent formamide hydrolase-like protein
MALFPDLVHMERLPADPAVKPLAVAGDDPRVHASAERGERIVRLQAERMAGLVRAALAGAGAARGKDAQ